MLPDQCQHAYIRTCLHISRRIDIHVHACRCRCRHSLGYICALAYVDTFIDTYIPTDQTYVYTYAYIYIYVCVCIHENINRAVFYACSTDLIRPARVFSYTVFAVRHGLLLHRVFD